MSTCIYIISPYTQERLPVDFDEKEGFEIEYSAVKLTDLNSPRSFLSKSIKLLGTKKTNIALQMLYRTDSEVVRRSESNDPNRLTRSFPTVGEPLLGNQYKVQIITDGADVLRGTGIMTIDNVDIDLKREYIEYDASVTGTRYNWIVEMDGKNLCDLTDLGTIEYSEPIIRNTWDRKGKISAGFDYTYKNCTFAPVHYGWWGLTANAASEDFVPFEDLRPNIYVKSVVDTIFSQYTSYTVQSSFFSSEFFTGLVMPYVQGGPRDAFKVDQEDVDNSLYDSTVVPATYDFTASIDQVFKLGVNSFVNNSWDAVLYEYTPAVSGTFDIELDITSFDNFAANNGYNVRVGIRDVLTDTDVVPNVIIWTDNTTTPQNIQTTISACLNANTAYYFYLIYIGAASSTFNVSGNTASISPVGAVGVCTSSDVDLSGVLSCNVSLKQFLDNLTTMFNLVWDTDPDSRIIYVEPDSEYFRCEDYADWTPYLDVTKSASVDITVDTVENSYFRYEEDKKDAFLIDLNKEEDDLFASGKLIFQASSEDTDEVDIDGFAASYFIRDFNVQGTAVNAPIWVRMWDQRDAGSATDPASKKYDYLPRIVYYYGLVDEFEDGYENPPSAPGPGESYYGFRYRDTTLTVNQLTYFPYSFFVNRISPSDNRSLSFKDSLVNDDVGLLTTYWTSYFNIVKEGRTVSLDLKLPTDEISNLKLFKPVFIANNLLGYSLYRISRISAWNPITKQAKVELLKL